MAKDDTLRLAEEAREHAQAALEAAQAAVRRARGAVEDGLDEAHQFVKEQWRERPLVVAGTALGVGMLLGVLLSSRR